MLRFTLNTDIIRQKLLQNTFLIQIIIHTKQKLQKQWMPCALYQCWIWPWTKSRLSLTLVQPWAKFFFFFSNIWKKFKIYNFIACDNYMKVIDQHPCIVEYLWWRSHVSGGKLTAHVPQWAFTDNSKRFISAICSPFLGPLQKKFSTFVLYFEKSPLVIMYLRIKTYLKIYDKLFIFVHLSWKSYSYLYDTV